jgi:hypothetical protein
MIDAYPAERWDQPQPVPPKSTRRRHLPILAYPATGAGSYPRLGRSQRSTSATSTPCRAA